MKVWKINVQLDGGKKIQWFVSAQNAEQALNEMERKRHEGHFGKNDFFEVEDN